MPSISAPDPPAIPKRGCRSAHCWTRRGASSRSRRDECVPVPNGQKLVPEAVLQFCHFPWQRLIYAEFIDHSEFLNQRAVDHCHSLCAFADAPTADSGQTIFADDVCARLKAEARALGNRDSAVLRNDRLTIE